MKKLTDFHFLLSERKKIRKKEVAALVSRKDHVNHAEIKIEATILLAHNF